MNKSKLLIVTSEFPPEPGGIGNHAKNLATYLVQKGYVVELICDQRRNNASSELLFDATLPFIVYRVRLFKIRALMYIKRFTLLFHHIRKNDIIIASGKFSLWTVASSSLFFKRKYIAVIHGSEVNLKNIFLKKVTNLSLKRFNSIIAVSNFTKSLIENLNLSTIHVIQNGFEKIVPSANTNEEISNYYPNFITVGSVTERKGQLNFIKAIPKLLEKYPDLHYHLVGSPAEKGHFYKEAQGLGVGNYLTFYGIVSDDKKHQLLKNSDLFVMLSNNTSTGDVEGFGIAILEANNLGVPAIGSKNCGIEDAIAHNKTGVLVDPMDEVEIFRAVNKILESKQQFSENAVNWSHNFYWDTVIDTYGKIIEA
ncbi:glycosyltransferase family 4 protein [Flavicella marina]|uniref:glycosyltransferase family 4 protein n=1 Tax=Flavicella marina TaxID=1475951 RepID=UPI00126548B8|nr:glycosyltransferase family 4 protein [Flavicella marina]